MDYNFIVLEGGDGTGKSTQARRLKAYIESVGKEVVLTREPGGTPGAEEIRSLLLTGDKDKLVPESDLLLFYAARMDHVKQLILPSLKEGKVVITDRFDLSTWAFQAEPNRDLHELFQYLHKLVTKELRSTWKRRSKGILLDVSLEVASERMDARFEELDRMENVVGGVIKQRRKAYLQKASELFPYYEIIDATPDEDTVFQSIRTALSK
ncbi:dTMP kinase [Candidatus Kaiserbacteria bacterium]|nr:MAG: dTMP kinase [Candidatus Kaiserbacteria bacterium]